ncbi:MAG: histidinol dehydrogenase [Coriobacteriia bacterium]|nr:histidinol dehydrogenase [Coriobacteriia bacterium]
MRVEYLEPGERIDLTALDRSPSADTEASETAAAIIAVVRERGDEALAEYTKEFDNATRNGVIVGSREVDRSIRGISQELASAINSAYQNIRNFHQQQMAQSWFTTRADGVLLGSMVNPIDSVGIYVPGGVAAYPSTVLMNAIPAKVAGVRRIAMVTPPRNDGTVDPAVLGAAHLVGVEEIYAVGGAQAIAALAYGTESIAPVDKIVGPGNAYVTAAKRLVSGDVGIDMIAGPSEVAILADETADATFVAIDLLAQAEHDRNACTFLVTTDESLVDEVIAEIEKQLTISPRQVISKPAIDDNCYVYICEDMDTAIDAINDIAPEHLEIMVDQAIDYISLIKNAGAIFIGPWSPVSVGDYIAGPNHTLPTNRTSRWASPLSVNDFIKRTSIVSYSFAALSNDVEKISALAMAEGLWAHSRSVEMRFEDDDDDDGEDAVFGELAAYEGDDEGDDDEEFDDAEVDEFDDDEIDDDDA